MLHRADQQRRRARTRTSQAQIDHIRDAAKRLTAMVDHLIAGRDGRRARHHDPPRAGRPRRPGQRGRRGQPAAGREQAADDRPCRRRRITSPCAMPTGCARRSTISSATPSSTARSAARSTCWSTREDDSTVIRSQRQGAGLSPEDIGRLFGRFQRLSAKPTAGESSTGLGLSIVKRIVDCTAARSRPKAPGPDRARPSP